MYPFKNSLVIYQVKGQTILWFSGMVASSCTAATMVRKGMVICTSAALKIKGISGRRFKLKVLNPSIDLVTPQLYTRTLCSYLAAGMGMILWMTFINTVFSQITGTKSTDQTVPHLNQDTDIPPSSVVPTSSSLEELTRINKDSTISINSTLSKEDSPG